MSEVLFSVIVPIYGVEPYLPQCIESIINQTYKNIEIILVDDGSPDECPHICDDYAKRDKRIKVIHQENRGVNYARRIGVKNSNGKYIVPIDSDDYISSSYLENFYNEILKYSPDMVVGGRTVLYNNMYTVQSVPDSCGYYNRERIEKELFPHLIQDGMCRSVQFNIWSKAYKRELLLKTINTVDDRISMGEDVSCVTLCYYKSQSIVVIPQNDYFYRHRISSITHMGPIYDWNNVVLRIAHLRNNIDCNQFDFDVQVNRAIIHFGFNVIESQFNRKAKYSIIRHDILDHLHMPLYRDALSAASFQSPKGIFAKLAMKYYWIELIYIYSKIRSNTRF